MLSICRLVPVEHGHGDLQQMERFQEIDFPSAGPSQATDRQKDILDQALKAISREDHDSSSGGQIVLVSPGGRIVAVENVEQPAEPNGFTWCACLLAVRQGPLETQQTEGDAELPTFMCEEQESSGNQIAPHCFEITDSLGRSWVVYQVRAGIVDWSEFQEMGGIQICQREDLAVRLGCA